MGQFQTNGAVTHFQHNWIAGNTWDGGQESRGDTHLQYHDLQENLVAFTWCQIVLRSLVLSVQCTALLYSVDYHVYCVENFVPSICCASCESVNVRLKPFSHTNRAQIYLMQYCDLPDM